MRNKKNKTEEARIILQSDTHPLLTNEGMFFKEFPSDFRQIRFFTLLVAQKAPPEIQEFNLLEQQISEIIKNAVKHGNKNDHKKRIRVWYTFSVEQAHLIVEDEGEGFKDIDTWNTFNNTRNTCLQQEDYSKLADYVSYQTEKSDEYDGGNALFATVEYWNQGVVFNKKGNVVGLGKKFRKKHPNITLA